MLSRRGRDSLEPAVWDELNRVADVSSVTCAAGMAVDEVVEVLAGADLVGATNLCLPTVDAALLDRLPRLRGIVLYATGYDHLDVDLLRARGVGLSVLSGYATTAVAEHGLAMLLAMATRLHLAHDRSRGAAPLDASLRGIELAGRTVGVVGVGRIGSRLARSCQALGMRVIGHDVDPRAESRAQRSGIVMGSLEWLLANSDAVVLCASHRFGAPPIVGASELATMGERSLLVNVARSALVDTVAAVAAVRSGRLRGYAVDDTVIDPSTDGDLLAEGRVLQTGHSAWWRDDVLDRGARLWGDRLVAAAGGTPIDVVTWPGVDSAVVPADPVNALAPT